MTDWWDLINTKAALRENTPDMRTLQHERPGCRSDRARQAFYAAENQAAKQADERRRWEASVARNARVREQQEQRAANARYNARKRRKQEAA